jgi:NADH-quinone oxidoreductase subunit L
MQNADLLVLIPLLPLFGFVVIGLLNQRLSNRFVSFLACTVVLAAFMISLLIFWRLSTEPGTSYVYTLYEWFSVDDFLASVSFLADPLSSLMMLIITGVGFLIHLYSVGYMHDDAGFNRFFAYLNLFIFFMLVLVMGSNYIMMFVGWEGVGLCSYLLIGFWFRNQEYNDAARKAFIMNRIGDLGLILGIILIIITFGTIHYADVFIRAESLGQGDYMLTAITILLFVGAIGKSAQIPLYTWLPDAMAGPTPVSALIHAATMVTAGIYMVARNNLLYSLSPLSLEIVMIVGLVTSLFAATVAVMQNDIKKILAYSTISQLGLIFAALGAGAYSAGVFHMMTHAFFKALLFLAAGSVIHALSGEQDLRFMGGLKKYLPVTWTTFLIAALAICGLPPFAGFFSKDAILAEAFANSPATWLVAMLTSLLTVFYTFRLLFLAFHGSPRASGKVMSHVHESPRLMIIPLVILAALSLIGGFAGVPEVLGGGNMLSNFLSPVFEKSQPYLVKHHLSHSVELMLMSVILLLTIIVIAITYSVYIKLNRIPADEKSLSGVKKLLYHKYYVDEIYAGLFVKPLHLLSTVFNNVIDKSIIDGAVNGAGRIVQWSSRKVRYMQAGNTGFYIFMMVISVIIILVAATWM